LQLLLHVLLLLHILLKHVHSGRMSAQHGKGIRIRLSAEKLRVRMKRHTSLERWIFGKITYNASFMFCTKSLIGIVP
jgi:hypothetical protein